MTRTLVRQPLRASDHFGALRLTRPAACADVIAALDECHARGFLHRAVGNCNKAKHAVNMCLREQRLERMRLNREKAKESRAKVEKVWAEAAAES